MRGGWLWHGLAVAVLTGCQDVQSALTARGPQAEPILVLSWILYIGGALILALVIVVTAIALFGSRTPRRWLGREGIVVAGGIVFPIVTLSLLLIYGFAIMRAGGTSLPAGEPLRITVVGEQWWWRVIYEGDEPFESANEIRIPTDRPVELALTTADVIHSFWVPHLAGKVDMIPGRTNRLTLAASSPGVSRGQCAEYCGGAHALMSFHVVAMPPDEYDSWRQREAATAVQPSEPASQRGQTLFFSSGCPACHAIRGTGAAGTIGPDLTHVGSRLWLAAATLPTAPAAFARWIRDNQHLKPENRMPPFRIFSESELAALADYLASLK